MKVARFLPGTQRARSCAVPATGTRAAYYRAVCSFFRWLEARHVHELGAIRSHHVTGYVEQMTHTHAAPTAKQHLDSIPTDTISGRRDRALIALLAYSFAPLPRGRPQIPTAQDQALRPMPAAGHPRRG